MTDPDVETGLLSLRTTSEEHHARLVPHVESLLTGIAPPIPTSGWDVGPPVAPRK